MGATFDTQRDDDAPVPSGSMSLVYVGSPEDDFRDAGRAHSLDGVPRVRFGRSLTGGSICFEEDTLGIRVGIPHPWVSGEHCQVELDADGMPRMQIRDLQSRNGTRVENKPVVGQTLLAPGEVFEVGRTFWMVRQGPPDSAAPDGQPETDPLYEPLFRTIRDTLLGVAATDVPVLVLGETGTGKERLARAIHRASGRRGEFVSVRLSAYTEEDLPAALLGTRRSSVPAFIERAEGGTLFLAGVAQIDAKMQSRLRALLSKVLEGRGSKRRDVRIVSASNRDLRRLVDEGRYRPDLYSRLAGVELALPPLRTCRDRLGALIRSFAEAHPEAGLQLSTRAFRFALAHRWPYNVRELRHALSTALTIATERGRINLAVLEEILRDARQTQQSSSGPYSS